MLLHDLRYGLRQLFKNPGFAFTAILTLALGIGMTASMFTVIYAVLLRPLPFPKSEQIVLIGRANTGSNHPGPSSLPDIRDWRDHSQSFQDIAHWTLTVHNIINEGNAELVVDVRCSANFFSMLQTQPIKGRTFYPDEDRPGKNSVAVLSATTWKNFFSSNPDIIGTNITLGTEHYTVIGVMPDNFIFPLTENRAMVWVPVQAKPEWENRNFAMLQVVGRLKDDASIKSAQAELTTIANRESTQDNPGPVMIEDYRESITGEVRTALFSLKAAVLTVWLIACINIVSLMLARSANRRRETAIRCALGADRGRLLRQFFAESALLGGMAGLLGLLLCFLFLGIIRYYLQSKLPFTDEMQVNLPMLGAILILSLASTLVVGLWPAMQAYKTSPQEALRDSASAVGTSRRQRRVQDVLVICEVAFSLVLLLSAGLLLRTLYNLRSTPLGFVPEHLIVAQLMLPPRPADKDVIASVYEPMLQTIREVPGVQSVAISTILPMSPNSTTKMPVQIFGNPDIPKQSSAELRVVSRDIYPALGIRLLAGRFFEEADTQSTPWVLIINQAFARKYFPDQNPLGQRIRTSDDEPNKYSTIVGVVEDNRQKSITESVEPEINICYNQLSSDSPFAGMLGFFANVAVRTQSDPSSITPRLRAVFQQINPETPANILTMESVVDNSLGNQTLASRLIGIFAGSALMIAIIGLYGLLSYNVTRSTRDIAVRLSLGATRSKVILLIVRHAAIVLGIGIAIGFAVWYQTARMLQSYLFGIGTHDILTIIAVAVVLLGIGLLASYLPARRASMIDPMTSLRHE